MNYLLEDQGEFDRLEKQALQKNYNLDEEFKHLKINQNSKILDAGCGSGLVSRFLYNKEPSSDITAIDFSDIRIAQAKKNPLNKAIPIQFMQADLNQLPFEDNSFDLVVSRFVYEYLSDPIKVTKELHRVLKPGGMIYLVDLDGVFVNFWTSDYEFNETLKNFSDKIEIDLFVGRKLSSFVTIADFKKIDWDVTLHKFKNDIDINQEKENNFERLKFAETIFTSYFDDRNQYEIFSKKYLDEMEKFKNNTLFFNKFSVWGEK